MSTSSEDELDDTQVRFQEAHGARLFRQGKPRALLEVKSPNIPTAIYEARLRGYDRAKTAKEPTKGAKEVTASRLACHCCVTHRSFHLTVEVNNSLDDGYCSLKSGLN
jgi:hypothetical protein